MSVELMREAQRRGILPPEKVALLEEYDRRQAAKPEEVKAGFAGYGQAVDTMVSAIPAEVAGGVTGLLTMLSAPVVGRDKAVDMANENMNSVRDFLTIKPKTPEAEKALGNISEFVAPVIDALARFEKQLGDTGYEIAGPEGGAVGASLPTAVMELIGIGLAKGGATALKQLPDSAQKVKVSIDERVSGLAGKPVIAIGDDGKFSPEALQVIEKTKGPEALAQAERFNLFKEYGVEPTRFDVTQKISDAVERQSALKRSGPVSELVASQDRRLSEVLDQNIDDLRPSTNTLEETNSSVFSVVDTVASDLEEGVNASYKLAREFAEGAPIFRPAAIMESMRRNASMNDVTDGFIDEIRAELQDQGLMDYESVGLSMDNAEKFSETLDRYSEFVNLPAQEVIGDLRRALDDDVKNAASLGERAVVKPSGLVEALRRNASKNGITNGLIAAIRGDLKEQGILKSGFKMNEGVGLRVKRAEEVRQVLNSYFEGANPQGRAVIRQLKDALDDDVADAVPVDVFQPARQAKSRMQQIIERGKRDKRDKTKGSFLESVLDNKIPEENIVPKLLSPSTRLDDFKAFKRFLLNDAGSDGTQAFQNIKAQALRNALEKAVSTAGKGEYGQVVFNANKFKQSFASLREKGKMKELFDAEEIKFIEDIEKIGSLRIAPSMVQQGRGPTELAVKALAEQVPGAARVKGLLEAGGAVLEDRRVLDAVSDITKSP